MKVLVTGFEPFGGVARNPSWDAVCLLPEKLGGADIARMELPVVYGEAGRMVCRRAGELSPDLVVCTGVAGGRKAVTPELIAVNWRMASIPDNAGQAYHGEAIDPSAPAALKTGLPVMALIDAAKAAGVPCALSLSAGAYVCNDVYWHALAGLGERCEVLFVHVPDAADLPSEQTAAALTAIIEAALRAIASK